MSQKETPVGKPCVPVSTSDAHCPDFILTTDQNSLDGVLSALPQKLILGHLVRKRGWAWVSPTELFRWKEVA
jgi:hypothetical protein